MEDVRDNGESDIEKIPKEFINTLRNNMYQEYYATLNIDEEYIDNKLSEEAKGVLGLVYRDYLTDESERNELVKNENKSEEEYQEILREMFQYDLVFKNNKTIDEKKKRSKKLE